MIIPQELQEALNKYKGKYPVPIVSIANDFGIDVFSTNDLSNKESGLIKKEGDKYVIYVNEKNPATRKVFTIAHEIAHYVKHKDLLDSGQEHIDMIDQPLVNGQDSVVPMLERSEKELTDKQKKIETEANYLAAEILMPEDAFKQQFSIANTIEEVADYFGVSPAAATIRAKYLLNAVIL